MCLSLVASNGLRRVYTSVFPVCLLLIISACGGESAVITGQVNDFQPDNVATSVITTVTPNGTPTSVVTVNVPAEDASPDSNNSNSNSNLRDNNFTPTVADITDLVLVTGQSNATGAGTDYNAGLDQGNGRVFAFTNEGWQVADLRQVWDLDWFPRGNPGSVPSNNFSLHFGKRVVSQDPGRVVGFVLVTAPGKSLAHWRGNGSFFREIRNKVTDAINQLPYKAKVDGILWHQGESDGRDDDAYGNVLYQLIDDFRSENWFDWGSPFICADTARLPVNVQLRRLNSDTDPWTACVAAEGLPTFRDGAHFSAEALRTMGQRYADQYLQMVR